MLLFCIIIGALSIVGLICSIIESEFIGVLAVFSVIGCICSFAGIIDILDDSPEIYEYKASEYTLEYKITTVGEQSDTTYVLTKIKEE